ncbi:hypothetical protein YC2023_062895 [Brassica napus]
MHTPLEIGSQYHATPYTTKTKTLDFSIHHVSIVHMLLLSHLATRLDELTPNKIGLQGKKKANSRQCSNASGKLSRRTAGE